MRRLRDRERAGGQRTRARDASKRLKPSASGSLAARSLPRTLTASFTSPLPWRGALKLRVTPRPSRRDARRRRRGGSAGRFAPHEASWFMREEERAKRAERLTGAPLQRCPCQALCLLEKGSRAQTKNKPGSVLEPSCGGPRAIIHPGALLPARSSDYPRSARSWRPGAPSRRRDLCLSCIGWGLP